jgi:murein DD-endopeptidase MepM/ murein hydrolase activator NlpD
MIFSPQRATSGTTARKRRATRFVAVAVALTLISAVVVVDSDARPAFAVDYPSWNDVQAARSSEQATVAKINEIRALLDGLRAEVARTQAEAIAKGEAYQDADQAFQEAALKATRLGEQADSAEATAAQSKQQAGEIVAQQYRSGNGDVSANLFVNAAKADDLLYTYGMADKFTEQTAGIYEKALLDMNTAQALTDQAVRAQELLEELRLEAEAALEAAQVAADAAAAAVAAQEDNEATLGAQLTVLTERRQATEADYAIGEAIRQEAIRVERARQAELARQAQAAAAAAAAASSGGGGGGGRPAAAPGIVGQSGWAKPAYGGITSGYGYRTHPISGARRLHAGTDIGAGCGQPIYAAHSGNVGYSGVNGSYGNFILINNGDNISTAYGHIINGGLLVGRGANVSSGQLIAYVGSTGGSTGCHLHYEVRVNGQAIDAAPFMRNQGITLG